MNEHKRQGTWFANHYRSKGVFKYVGDMMHDGDALRYSAKITTIDGTFQFEPWHHFIITRSNDVIVFVFDTRKVVHQCAKADLDRRYPIARIFTDNYLPLDGYEPVPARLIVDIDKL